MKRSLLLFVLFITACAHGAGVVAGGKPPEAAASERARDQAAGSPAETTPAGEAEQSGRDAPLRPEPQSSGAPRSPPEGQPAAETSAAPPDTVREAEARSRLVRAARSHLGRYFAGDCSTFVRRVYAEAGVTLPTLKAARTMTESLYRSLWPVPEPQPGDLVYFKRTRKRDRAGKSRDRLTHVAIVEAVDGSSVIMIHRGSRGIRRLAMNLERPHDPEENGIVRRRWGGEAPGLPSLAGELFAGYGSALGGKLESSRALRVERAPPRRDDGGGVPRG